MSKRIHQSRVPTATNDADQRLLVRGDRRKEPDWDVFIAALIAYALREVDDDVDDEVGDQVDDEVEDLARHSLASKESGE
jgi:hypothetical protein